MPKKELPKIYNPADYENDIYKKWEKSGFFNPDKLKGEPYSIMMPPPNVTGVLHLGHALENSLMDIMARYQRMNGRKVLLLPGTDHAAVATQAKVEKILIESGIRNPRQELGREKLLEKIREYAEESKSTILKQIKKMGTSCDWSRLAYTFDATRNRAVNEVFVKMYNNGLIYRGKRIINWDAKLQTTISDDEIVWQEEKVPFYYLQYGPFVIATARPETKFGDKYVVMHPDDKRYKKYKHGDKFECEWLNGKVSATVIKDEIIDPKFGTGVMTITPWHDMVDFEIAERHKLSGEQIIDFNGKLMPIAGEFAGMTILEARLKIAEKLKAKGLMVKVEENYLHRVAKGDRSHASVEPQIKEQWFVAVNKIIPGKGKSLKDLMREAVTTGHNGDEKQKVKITPERFEKVYLHWIDNLRDWCISRQIWWGHRIPVYYRKPGMTNDQFPCLAGRQAISNGVKQKKLGFHSSIVPELLAGKRRTYRIHDHNLAVGDRVVMEDSGSNTLLGYATITGAQKLTIGHIPLPDMIHSGKYKTTAELIQAFKRMHPEEKNIDKNTPAFIYDYDFSPLKKEQQKNIVSITYFVHGTTLDNEKGLSSGQADAELSELGIKQSKELAKVVSDKKFDMIFTSDLKRAVDTAKLAFGKSVKIIKDKRLRECDYGKMERKDEEQILAMGKEIIDKPFPGGESYKDVEKRINDFLNDLMEKYPGKKVAIVAHKVTQLALEVLLNNKTWEQAIDEDWRKKKAWQPGWKYEVKSKKSKVKSEEIYVGIEAPKGDGWKQDEDTLDTWFSSGLWTFSTLGWPSSAKATAGKPDKNNDLKTFHPTSWMQMGYEILFFWMARMILMSTYVLDQIPFKDVYIHGMLRSESGKKFSKSSGNNIDPLEVIAKFGTDALRLSVISGIAPGNDSKFYEEKVEGARNMVNKLWNISRYIITNYELKITNYEFNFKDLTLFDKWILFQMRNLILCVREDLDNYRFSQAVERIKEFTWNDLADWYLEVSKFEKNSSKDQILAVILNDLLKLWHPFIPFVTEAIWQEMGNRNLLLAEKYPQLDNYKEICKKTNNGDFYPEMVLVQKIITTIRNARSENKVEPNRKIKAVINTNIEEYKKLIEEHEILIKGLKTGIDGLEVKIKGEKIADAIYAAVGEIEIYLLGAVDSEKEKVRLEKEIANLEKVIKTNEGRLSNKEFVDKAPAAVVKNEREKLAGWQAELKKLMEQLRRS